MIGEVIIFIFFAIVLYGLLIHAYIDPEESYMMGKRWMYEDEVELTEEFKSFIRFSAMVGIIFLTIVIIVSFIRIF